MTDIVELTIKGAQAAFASGTTSEALTQACLDRTARYDPAYNAIIFLNPDARAIDRQRRSREALGLPAA